jgi:DNA polymerase V
VVDGEFTCKRLEKRGTEMRLVPESPNPKFKPLILSEGMEVNIWGVVTSIVIDAKNRVAYDSNVRLQQLLRVLRKGVQSKAGWKAGCCAFQQ